MTSFAFTGPHGERMAPTAVVDTHLGPVQGLVVDGIHRFLGIRYAAAPLGRRRFQPPEDPAPWSVVQEAIHYGAPAMQGIRGPETAPRSDFALTQLVAMPIGGHVKINSEDCLWLNVWTPAADDARRPVMVWIHGGGYAYGAGSEPMYEGSRLARRGDVVVVTVNHRLNLFGYLDLVGIHPDYAQSVNVGNLDLVHALTWVRRNIAAFGGDPDNVTVAGESGGASKVNALLAMPAAAGLFHKAIMQSGAQERIPERAEVQATTRTILDALALVEVTPAALSAIPAADLLESAIVQFEAHGDRDIERARSGSAFTLDLALRLMSTRDGTVIPRQPYGDDEPPPFAADVPVIIGWTKDEWALMMAERDPGFVDMSEEDLRAAAFGIYGSAADAVVCALREAFPDYRPGHLSAALVSVQMIRDYKRVADLKSRQPAPVYCYQLSWESPVGDGIYRAAHAMDLPLVFDNVARARPFVGEGEEPQLLADQMSEAWIAFLRTGDPGHAGIPEWPRWDAERRPTLVFDVIPRLVDDPLGEFDALTAQSSLQP